MYAHRDGVYAEGEPIVKWAVLDPFFSPRHCSFGVGWRNGVEVLSWSSSVEFWKVESV